MAFSVPSSHSAPELAQQLSLLLADPRDACNITKQLTCGLKSLYQRIEVSTMTREALFSSNSDYVIRRQITEGTFSAIKLARCIDGKDVVIKQVHEAYAVLAYREVILLRYLQSKTRNVPCVRDFYKNKEGLCIVLDAYDSTLYATIQRNKASHSASSAIEEAEHKSDVYAPRPKRKCIVQPILAPVTHAALNSHRRIRVLQCIAAKLMVTLYLLRTENIIHADIKPENIFVRFPAGNEVNVSAINDISKLPDDFELHLGDFGNAFHISETQRFYEKFDIQSMPYRSPEILLGVPFNTQIDMWSLGIVLLEIYTGFDFFDVASPRELFLSINQRLTRIPMQRYIGGKFSELFACQMDNIAKLEHAVHLQMMHRLVSIYPMPFDLFHFFCSLLHPDPDERMNPIDGLKHDFIAAQVQLPLHLLPSRSTMTAKRQHGIVTLRRGKTGANGYKHSVSKV